MVDIRQATMYDIPGIQARAFLFSPEEKPWDYVFYEFYIISSPQLVYVTEGHGTGRIVGYVVGRMKGEGVKRYGYILSLCVLPSHRYENYGTAVKLCDDGEDAYVLRKQLQEKQPDHIGDGFSHGGGYASRLIPKRTQGC
ncbi:N-terminal acetyltransferase A complex catalytic subunit NAA10-like [Papaver somniferum]|uniref:N-terminal acetyltransferase A complex catalytic subunit NAA10-like n=1 Tax=Papaver somniferum TaxID=3469 RepID=UPI000E6F7EF5|nr:N-terminal acetyltransferase A complex catalytic subunit NAA10-like [Papaver somniferum]